MIDIYKNNLVSAINLIEDDNLRSACREILRHEDFFNWPGSIGKHHAYKHGLLIHTIEVFRYAHKMSTSEFYWEIDQDVLIASILWHDFAKIFEYEKDPMVPNAYIRNNYYTEIHHISGSMAEFLVAARKNNVLEEKIRKVQHCILSHHGWINGVKTPQTLEAVMLHQADMLSAFAGKTK